jgi:hypothetical protein
MRGYLARDLGLDSDLPVDGGLLSVFAGVEAAAGAAGVAGAGEVEGVEAAGVEGAVSFLAASL